MWHALHGRAGCGWPGAPVNAGDRLTQGQREAADLLRTRPVPAVAAHIVDELARRLAYERVTLAESHLELIVRAMLGHAGLVEPLEDAHPAGTGVEARDHARRGTGRRVTGARSSGSEPILTGVSLLGSHHPGLLHRVRFTDPAATWVLAALSGQSELLTSPAVPLECLDAMSR